MYKILDNYKPISKLFWNLEINMGKEDVGVGKKRKREAKMGI